MQNKLTLMKKIGLKYFFLLFISVLSCLGVYTKSIQNTGKIFSHYVVHHTEVNSGRKQHLTQSSLAYEVELENVEISESEIDETDFSGKKFLNNFRFSDAYLSTNILENQISVIKNGLTSCNYEKYLASTNPLNIRFCVYRI
ncbi:hypothetical protein [Flavobacterium terrigena]|nr:hypothetical protein [Flavobacterium terrigena]